MLLAILLLAAGPTGPAIPADVRFEACMDTALTDTGLGIAEADRWIAADGGFIARACKGFALSEASRFAEAQAVFAEASRLAEDAGDRRAGRYAAQAGNAALVAGDAAAALALFERAATLSAKEPAPARGAILLDRARALVALGREAEARALFPAILDLAPADPLAWLLSATLARRMGDFDLARAHAAEAGSRATADPAIALELGNIAYAGGDEANARTLWQRTIDLAPASDAAATASAHLARLGVPDAGTPSVAATR